MNYDLNDKTALFSLLTESEVANLAKRLHIARALLEGKTHREIIEQTKTSFATITKVSSILDLRKNTHKILVYKTSLEKKHHINLHSKKKGVIFSRGGH